MAKRPAFSEWKTEYTTVNLDDIRFPKYERIRVNYPLVPDRSAQGRVYYKDESEHRWSRGRTPIPAIDMAKLSIIPPKDLDSAEYKFVSDAKTGSNVPEGYYGTSSGIYPIDFVPFTNGSPTDSPVTITGGEQGSNGDAEFIIGRNVETSNMDGIVDYITTDSGSLNTGRLNWEIKPEFDNPTAPAVRYPLGARKRNFFK